MSVTSGPRIVWRPDVKRHDSDPAYRDAVAAFVGRHLPRASVSGAHVIEADDGERALFASSFVDEHGDWYRDELGRVIQRARWAIISTTEELP